MGAGLPKEPPHPGEVLPQEFLRPLGLTQSAFPSKGDPLVPHDGGQPSVWKGL